MEIEPGEIAMDPGALAMTVRCLIENAAEAMPGGGVVTMRAAPEGSMFRIDVADEGRGLPDDVGERVFQAFFTTKPGRAGLGLSMASRAARRAEGRLSLSQEARGVIASLWFPLSRSLLPALPASL